MKRRITVTLTEEQIHKLEELTDVKIEDDIDVQYAINIIIENL